MTITTLHGPAADSMRRICGALCLTLTLAACGDDGGDDATSAAETTTETASASATEPSTTDGPATVDPSAESSITDPSAESGDTTIADTSGSDSGGESESGSESESGDSTGTPGLEIVGMWVDDFGGAHAVTDTSWATSYGDDVYAYTITEYDNPERFVIAQSDDDDTWSKFEWTYADEALYFCQSAFGEATAADAANAPDADPTDPAASGCGGFTWSLLTAAD